jgi:SAM-dependent methyltransferase
VKRFVALARALRRPADVSESAGFWRTALRRPRIFDLVSCALQLRDLDRLATIHEGDAGDAFFARVKDYNSGVTQRKVVSTTRRAELMYQLLTAPARDVRGERLLIVGPRNVQELYIAWLYGYRWRNIVGIDLYSTSRKIVVMNMEVLGVRDASVDAIAMANTLSYARDTFQCLSEMARVLTPGGRFVFGATYYPQSRDWPGNLVSGAEIREMLKRLGFRLAAYHAFDKVNSLGGQQTAHIFMVQKPDARQPGFDRVSWL